MQRLVIDRARPAGFFSDFIWIVSGFAVAAERGYIPFVPTTKNTCRSGITPHWKWDWSDYFIEPGSKSPTTNEGFEFLDLHEHPAENLSVGEMGSLKTVFQEYSGIKPEVETSLNRIAESLIPQGTLGVHFRSGDMRWTPSHPTPPSIGFMLKIIESEIKSGQYQSIYVASEDRRFIRAARKRFPSLDVISSEDSLLLVDKSFDASLSKAAVLTDAYLLGRCRRLVHSASNVAYAAKFFSSVELRGALEVRMGFNDARLPISFLRGVIFWPLFSKYRASKSEMEYSPREDWMG